MEYIIIILHWPQNYYKRLIFWNNLLTVATYVTFLESELFFFVNLEVKLHRLRNTPARVSKIGSINVHTFTTWWD